MNKQEFRDFCFSEFAKKGFEKHKKMYWMQGKDFLCGLYLQKSMAEAYYVEWDFFMGKFDKIKDYPSVYDSDVAQRFTVWSKTTGVDGECFMTSMIEYELYSEEDIKPYFDQIFEEHIMPALIEGKEFLLKDLGYYIEIFNEETLDLFYKKLGVEGKKLQEYEEFWEIPHEHCIYFPNWKEDNMFQ